MRIIAARRIAAACRDGRAANYTLDQRREARRRLVRRWSRQSYKGGRFISDGKDHALLAHIWPLLEANNRPGPRRL